MSIFRLLPLLLLATPAAAEVGQPLSPLTAELTAIAGDALPRCGVAVTPDEVQAALDCIRDALGKNQPFVAQVRVEGIDSIVWQAAIQLPSGQRVLLQHDSFGEGRTTRVACQTFSFTNTLLPIRCER